MLHPKKVGTLPVEGRDEEKQTNEIKTAIPLLDAIDIRGKTITADALLTQRELARYFDRFDRKPNHTALDNPDHGRTVTRNIWVTAALNDYLNFPYVGQAFLVERNTIYKKSGKESRDIAYGITSKTAAQASPEQVLQDNRKHWSIENRRR